MSKREIKIIPEILKSPAVVVYKEGTNRLALISENLNEAGKPMLLALELDVRMHGVEVNNITSFYGREKCKEYLKLQKNVTIVDNKKAKMLSRLLGLQLPMAWKVLDSTDTLYQPSEKVKCPNPEKSLRSKGDIVKDIQKSGFVSTKNLISLLIHLDTITGKENSLKDISDTYKKGCPGMKQEEKELVSKIAEECRQQELAEQPGAEPEPGE